ncbi:MAG: PIN domain-containing protein [Acidobacteriota bacterium]
MILIDTNVLIYAFTEPSPFFEWAQRTIAEAVSEDGAAVNAVCLAEVCVGEAEPAAVADRLRSWGITLLDVPVAAAEPCAKAYVEYRERRRAESGREAPSVPLPDFFIGAHAQVKGWTLATADGGRFRTYFPSVTLQTPSLG